MTVHDRYPGGYMREVLAREMSMTWDTFLRNGGRQHTRAACRASRKAGAPKNCVIHNPSRHHMRDWTLVLRSSGLLERMCEHGVGHPDPDSVAYFNWRQKSDCWGVHGCCQAGCCGMLPPDAKSPPNDAKAR